MKKHLSLFLSAALLLTALAGCGGGASSGGGSSAPSGSGSADASASGSGGGSASGEDKADTAILVVSFGTSFNDSREATIGAIEKAIGAAYPQYEVRRAFTSQIIIDKLAKRDGLKIDNVTEALDRAAADGIKNLIVQPTHLMDGLEYNDLVDELGSYSDVFDQIVLGAPLLTSDQDFKDVIASITGATAEYDDGKTAVVFMGHGTEADSNAVYAKLQEMLSREGFDNYYIGTVEAEPTLEDVMALLAEGGYARVVLEPLMVVCGDHANNDMAGDEEDSWKTLLTDAGYEVECLLQGLGEQEAIRQIYVAHVQAAAAQLKV